jgi:formate--tetrahydrofolate ligase
VTNALELTTREIALRPIVDVAADIGLTPDDLELYGPVKAKVTLDAIARAQERRSGKYVIVTSLTPTPLGEGKTTTSIGLAQACWRIGVRSIVTIRQPSIGPAFGIKGGGAGGGRSTIEPLDELNLHLTGDSHAVTTAHNACAAFIDNHLHQGNALGLDQTKITWPRAIDMNDRALREIMVGLAPKRGPARQTGFEITAASEVMSILSVANSLEDLRARLGRIVVGFTRHGDPVTAEQLQVAGAMAALMRDAIKPNLLQTQEGTPAFVHSGPFGNVALGNSSVLADRLGLGLADVAITEAGFGSELGFEKFCNVKCRFSGLRPDASVVVVTVRSLKAHSGRFTIRAGKPLDPGLEQEDMAALEEGLPNLAKHLDNVAWYGIPAVVAINAHPSDTSRELERIADVAALRGAATVVSRAYADGGAGAEELARATIAACERGSTFRFLYDLDQPILAKIEEIARVMYGAEGVDLTAEAKESITRLEADGFGHLPICMAKTQYSLSGDPSLKGRPEGFRLTVRDVLLYAGAGYLVPLAGSIMLMPGLGKHPSAANIDLLSDGTIIGLT